MNIDDDADEMYTSSIHLEVIIMKANMLDLRNRMADILRAIDRNESVTILYRGREKAVLMPVGGAKPRLSIKEHKAFGMWKDREDMADPADVVRSMRKGRAFAF